MVVWIVDLGNVYVLGGLYFIFLDIFFIFGWLKVGEN